MQSEEKSAICLDFFLYNQVKIKANLHVMTLINRLTGLGAPISISYPFS
jgi:hypothetical protein